ncbi:endocuticle structural glycoprotein SgAbd-3-like isoform X2 [Sitophilus oryzae]|uniref:Endocuticle structural glycoprotein SgAbd-3-like isoform X2 n=1 Tax=Sitophilus oryzae TaxID=7048 RepID=A0A6J2YA00_SITOR|nr:endocuticle structural glycoprotein SgAbd-3-like isoform X2 [Sitophilus oryzae]
MNLVKSLLIIISFSIVVSDSVDRQHVRIISQENDIQPDGTFRWSFETEDGTKQEQNGQPKQIEQEVAIVLQGSASWIDDEGNPHQLTYIADENGYQPQSADIPVAPEVPAAIARSLEYNSAHPEQEAEQPQVQAELRAQPQPLQPQPAEG